MSDLSHVDDEPEDIIDGEGDEGGAGGSDEIPPEDLEDDEDPEDDDPAPEDDGQGRRQPVEGQQPQRTRSQSTVQRTRERAQQAEARAREYERRITELEGRLNQQPTMSAAEQARLQAEEDARYELMTPAEQRRYLTEQITRSVRGELHQNQIATQETLDRTRFEQMQLTNPLAKKYASDVETLVREQRGRGLVTPRDVALAYIIGRKAIDKAMAGAAPSRESQRRRTGTEARPTRSGTQGRSSNRADRNDDSEEALERRLGGVTF